MTKTTNLFFSIVAFAAVACVLPEGLNAQTTFTGGATDPLDVSDPSLWSNGIPSLTNPATVSSAYDGLEVTIGGNLNTSGNVNLGDFPGGFSITQAAGDATVAQFNFNANPDFVYNLDGGSITSDAGTVFANFTTLNVNGGTFTKTGGEFRVGGGIVNLTSGSITTERTLIQNGGTCSISGGTLTAADWLNRGGTMNVSGGILNNDAPVVAFNRNNGSTDNTNDFSGGIINIPNAQNLFNSTGQLTTISGDFVLVGANITNIFNVGGVANTSTLDFDSAWTGSLTLDSATAWETVFNSAFNADPMIGTGISVDGVLLDGSVGASFSDFFTNTSGVVTLSDSTLKGDVNLDTVVNFLDISPFIGVLSSGGFQAEADVDCNGVVNFLDISPFIGILSGQ